jgi:transposase
MIPKNHICFFVEEFVESLDFTGFDMINEGPGHPSYHPRIIMKVLLQGMLSKERSSRRLASACRENFVFMYLAEKVQPNFRTICRFRADNAKFIKEAFKETVKLASENNLIDLSLICTDGSKVKANASKRKFLAKEQLDRLDLIIEDMTEEDMKQDELDNKISEKEDNLTDLDTKDLKEIVRAYRKCKNKEKLKEKWKRAKEEFSKGIELKKVSITDPDCRIVKYNIGASSAVYNTQFTVDSKNQIILANDVCKDTDDSRQLEPQLKQTKENMPLKKDTRMAADCGYSSGNNFRFLEDEGIIGYIPNKEQAKKKEQKLKFDNYEYDEETDEIISDEKRFSYMGTYYNKKDKYRFHRYRNKELKLNRDVPEFFRERLRMKARLETREGKITYDIRKFTVEPVIGNIKYNLGFREFLLRGLKKARSEMNIVSAAHNLKKIWKAKISLRVNRGVQEIIFEFLGYEPKIKCDTA